MTATPGLRDNYKGVFDGRVGFGHKPALLIVDFIRAYTTPGHAFFAPAVWQAVVNTVPLLASARRNGVLIVHTRVEYAKNGLDGGVFVKKVPALRELVFGAQSSRIVPELEPRESEVVVTKQYASAFFATSLASMLTAQRVDTVVIVGCSTSGCVRATAVDGMQHGFRVVVPRECVGDRHQAPHEANLFDIDSKYGDVLPVAEVLAKFEELSS